MNMAKALLIFSSGGWEVQSKYRLNHLLVGVPFEVPSHTRPQVRASSTWRLLNLCKILTWLHSIWHASVGRGGKLHASVESINLKFNANHLVWWQLELRLEPEYYGFNSLLEQSCTLTKLKTLVKSALARTSAIARNWAIHNSSKDHLHHKNSMLPSESPRPSVIFYCCQ